MHPKDQGPPRETRDLPEDQDLPDDQGPPRGTRDLSEDQGPPRGTRVHPGGQKIRKHVWRMETRTRWDQHVMIQCGTGPHLPGSALQHFGGWL